MLANQLSGLLDRPVLDETGLSGRYDISLIWSPRQQAAAEANGDAGGGAEASLSTAIQEQLGLRLDTRKGRVDALVNRRFAENSGRQIDPLWRNPTLRDLRTVGHSNILIIPICPQKHRSPSLMAMA
jgi:hypothetical protein